MGSDGQFKGLCDEEKRYLDLLKIVLTASCYEESAWSLIRSDRKTLAGRIGRFVVRRLRNRGIGLVRFRTYNEELRSNGQDWPMFSFTMVGLRRLTNVQWCIEDALIRGVEGDFVEAGCWRGGVGILAKAVFELTEAEGRRVILADSFQGMPIPKDSLDGVDISGLTYLEASLEQVQQNFRRFGVLDDSVVFIKGFFEDTLPTAPIDRIAVLRLDADLYHSTMDVLNNLYFKVSLGGFVIVDDYFSWEPCRRAVTDFLRSNGLSPDIIRIDNDGAYWVISH